MTTLLKAAQSFYRVSQDILTPVKTAVESALSTSFPDGSVTVKTLSVIGSEVKVSVSLTGFGQSSQTNRSNLQQLIQFAVSKVNSSLKVFVTIDMSSESTVNASRARGINKRAQQDPMAAIRSAIDSTLATNVSPDVAEVQTIAWVNQAVKVEMLLHPERGNVSRSQLESLLNAAVKKVNPALQLNLIFNISSEGKVASFRKKLNIKLAQEAETNVKLTIEESLKGIPDSKLLSLNIAGLNVGTNIEVPEKHSFTASQLEDTLTRAIQSVMPGGRVGVTLHFQTTKSASRRKYAQDMKTVVQNIIASALTTAGGLGLRSFVFQPETKHVLVEIGKASDNKLTSQQISAFLTNKIQAVAPGFSAIATTTSIL